MDKSKLIIYKSKQKIISDTFSIKLNGVKLIPTDNVKYLGRYIVQNLSFDYHINQLSKKLSRSNGTLAKLRHFTSKETLISVYNSIFYSHLLYGCPVWSLTTINNLNSISILEKKFLRIINFSPFNSHTNNLFIDNKILKLDNIIKSQQMKLVFDFKNNNLPDDLSKMFTLNSNINKYNTRNVFNKGMYIPRVNTKTFGINSLKYTAPLIWNSILKNNKSINSSNSNYSLNKTLKKYFFSLYKLN